MNRLLKVKKFLSNSRRLEEVAQATTIAKILTILRSIESGVKKSRRNFLV